MRSAPLQPDACRITPFTDEQNRKEVFNFTVLLFFTRAMVVSYLSAVVEKEKEEIINLVWWEQMRRGEGKVEKVAGVWK